MKINDNEDDNESIERFKSPIVIIPVLFIIVFIILLTACHIMKTLSQHAEASEDRMFVTIEGTSRYYIVYDKETMVEYIISSGNINTPSTFIMLVNADGTPKLYKEE